MSSSSDNRGGGVDLQESHQTLQAVMAACRQPNRFAPLYDVAWPIKRKIDTIATRMYGASCVSYGAQAERDIEQATREAMAALDFWTITAVSVEEANL